MDEMRALSMLDAASAGAGDGIAIPELLWNACDGMMIIDAWRRVMAINPALREWVGYKADGVACGDLLGCRDFNGCPLANSLDGCPGLRVLKTLAPIRATEYIIQTAGGKSIPVSASYTPIQLKPGGPVWTLVILRDMAKHWRLERRLRHRAMTDLLTGLANRASFMEAAQRELTHARRMHRCLSLALIDLDGLKQHNDTAGHAAGDALLRSVAHVLASGHRGSEIVARYGGDEFAILFPDTDATGAMLVVERLRKAVSDFPFARRLSRQGQSLFYPVTISLGVAVFPNDALGLEDLLSCADQRLYEAKHLGRNRIVGPTPQAERRRYARVNLKARALLQNPPGNPDTAIQEAVVANVSLSGALLSLPFDHRLKLEYPLLFVIEIPQAFQARFPFARLSGRAHVVRMTQESPRDEQAVEEQVGIALAFDREPSAWNVDGDRK